MQPLKQTAAMAVLDFTPSSPMVTGRCHETHKRCLWGSDIFPRCFSRLAQEVNGLKGF
jgi:hypothetical protein